MATGKALYGKPDAGNPHVRFDEGEVASAATPRRGSLLYNFSRRDFIVAGASAGMMAAGNAAFGEVLGPEVRKLKGFAPLNVKRIFVEVGAEAGSIRQIKLSHGNIDAGVLDDGTRAFVGFANYNVSEVKGLVATFKLKKRYENVKTLDGASVKVEWDGTTARCEFDLGDSQALLFR